MCVFFSRSKSDYTDSHPRAHPRFREGGHAVEEFSSLRRSAESRGVLGVAPSQNGGQEYYSREMFLIPLCCR
jgi:hypothetical protein